MHAWSLLWVKVTIRATVDKKMARSQFTIPLVRSAHNRWAKSDPLEYNARPNGRRKLIDDLWAMALANLPGLKSVTKRLPTVLG